MPLHYNPTRKQSTILSTQLQSTYWTHSTHSALLQLHLEIGQNCGVKTDLCMQAEWRRQAARIGKDIARHSQQQLKIIMIMAYLF